MSSFFDLVFLSIQGRRRSMSLKVTPVYKQINLYFINILLMYIDTQKPKHVMKYEFNLRLLCLSLCLLYIIMFITQQRESSSNYLWPCGFYPKICLEQLDIPQIS